MQVKYLPLTSGHQVREDAAEKCAEWLRASLSGVTNKDGVIQDYQVSGEEALKRVCELVDWFASTQSLDRFDAEQRELSQ